MDDGPGELLDGREGVALRADEDAQITALDPHLAGVLIDRHGLDPTLEVEGIDESIEELGHDPGVFGQIDVNGFGHGVFLPGGRRLLATTAAIRA